MKKLILIGLLGFMIACNHTVEKPNNLIPKDKMTDILYDLSLLEAIKSQNVNGGISNKNANTFIYKKYKIDSLQLVRSNKYYASDIESYKKMFQEVKRRLEEATRKTGGATENNVPNPTDSDRPQVQ